MTPFLLFGFLQRVYVVLWCITREWLGPPSLDEEESSQKVVLGGFLLHPMSISLWGGAGFHSAPMCSNTYMELLEESHQEIW